MSIALAIDWLLDLCVSCSRFDEYGVAPVFYRVVIQRLGHDGELQALTNLSVNDFLLYIYFLRTLGLKS